MDWAVGMRGLFIARGEEGFTTVGTAVALLLAIVLAFGGVQACWVQSRSGQVQYVADAAALAADGVVAEYVVYAQTIDAAILSLSLIGLASYAASAVAAFVPGGEGVAAKFVELGSKVFETRESFAKSAVKGLNMAQKLMPAICTKRAYDVLEANSAASGISYHGVAVPLPLTGEKLSVSGGDELRDATEEIASKEQEVEEEVKKQEKAREEMEQAKERAWQADCAGNVCMRERASTLAGLSGAVNPQYTDVDSWSFSVPIERAKAYYKARQKQEAGSSYGGSPELVAESVARKAFYGYAAATVSKGSVSVDSQGNEAPRLQSLARNKEQMKKTYLYTESAYPVCQGSKGKVLHAYEGCPGYVKGSPAGRASVSAIDAGEMSECAECKFSIVTLGRVPSASTSIDNGFEYYYRLVVEASEDYRSAAREVEKSSGKLRDAAEEMQGSFKDALSSLAGMRLNIQPPGRYGCVCIVVADESTASIGGSFARGQTTLAPRVAVSAATLAEDEAVDQAQVISNVGSGLVPQECVTGALAKALFGAWGKALGAYAQGVTGVEEVIKGALASIPLVGTDLSAWVADGFSDAATASGLAPAELKAFKPVLVASKDVLEADGSSLSGALLSAKRGAELASEVSIGELSNAIEMLKGLDLGEGEVSTDDVLVLATLSLSLGNLGVGERPIGISEMGDLVSLFAESLSSVQGGLR